MILLVSGILLFSHHENLHQTAWRAVAPKQILRGIFNGRCSQEFAVHRLLQHDKPVLYQQLPKGAVIPPVFICDGGQIEKYNHSHKS